MKARGYLCAKGCNSSASQWLSGEQVRLCSGHPKVHIGTIVEGSWGACTVGPPGSLTICVGDSRAAAAPLVIFFKRFQVTPACAGLYTCILSI